MLRENLRIVRTKGFQDAVDPAISVNIIVTVPEGSVGIAAELSL